MAKQLSELSRRVLDFELTCTQDMEHGRQEAIRKEFGLSTVRFIQILNHVIDEPAALIAEPMLVKRLQRDRARRVGARASRAFAHR